MKRFCFCLLFFLFVFSICSCADPFAPENPVQESAPRAGMKRWVDGLPEIQSLSGERLEDFEYQFSEPSAAVLHRIETEESVRTDDPRLFRLLNLIAYSESHGTCWLTQGYVDTDVVTGWCREAPYLEVSFDTGKPHDDTLGDLSKIIVVRGTVFMFEEEERIERHWPYLACYEALVEQGEVEKSEFRKEMAKPEDPSEAPWLNLLTYCAFP